MTAIRSHPYMANSNERDRKALLEGIGIDDVEELFEQIPKDHFTSYVFDLPDALISEVSLRRELTNVISRNSDCQSSLSFLGGGVWQHHVPAICDEVWQRSEFLTSVWGTGSSDVGRNQAWFEYASQLAELVGLDFVGLPVYSWGAAVGHSMRMAARITGRSKVLVPANMSPERLSVARTYCGNPQQNDHIAVVTVAIDPSTGRMNLTDLHAKLDDRTAAVYIENPSYLGLIEQDAFTIARAARAIGAETVVGVDPSSLGIIAEPSSYGADIVVGTTQPLGVHMNGGGGVGGFIATRDSETYAREYPTLQVSITDTTRVDEIGFGMPLFEQSSYGSRENANDWTGNSVYLWAIANAVYMSSLGPQGFRELGSTIVQHSHYAAGRLGDLPGVSIQWPDGFFKEFVVNLNDTGRTVGEVDEFLRGRNIFGGIDLSNDFPDLGQALLVAVTEIHTMADIDRFVDNLREAVTE